MRGNRSRRRLALLVIVTMLMTWLPLTAAAQGADPDVVVFTVDLNQYEVNGELVEADAAPYIQDNRIMVPVAFVSRALGAEVAWEAATKTVTVVKDEDVITMVIGSQQLMKNGELFEEMDTVPVIQITADGLGRTMLPVSRLARALDMSYFWDGEEKTVTFVSSTMPPYDQTGLTSEWDAAIFQIMEEFGVAAISAAVVENDQVTWSGSYGWHDMNEGTVLRPDSAIRIASISKSVTALAVMQLVEAGEIVLDEDINAYLSQRLEELEVEIRNPLYPDTPVTVKQLLNHTSGIRNSQYVAFSTAAREKTPVPTLDDYFGETGEFYHEDHWATFGPGDEFEYSNMGYVILGAIIESMSGERFDVYTEENILAPLGMNNSSFNVNELSPEQVTPMYRRESDLPHFSQTLLPQNPSYEDYVPGTHGGMFGPQGGLLATSEDLAAFMVFMINGDEAILSNELLDEMHSISVETDKGGAATFWGIYTKKGLGIHVTEEFVDGLTMYGHPGGAYGIITDLYYTRDEAENVGIVFLINGCNEEIFGDRSAYYLIEEALADLLYSFTR